MRATHHLSRLHHMTTRRFALTPAACAAALLVAGTAFAQDGVPANLGDMSTVIASALQIVKAQK